MPNCHVVVTLAAGDSLPNEYIDRLYSMLCKHSGREFRLVCLTDRNRNISDNIEQLDITEWKLARPDLRLTQHRLRYFKPGVLPYPEFLTLDLTLVIKSSMHPLWEFCENQTSAITIVKDWHHPTVNGSVVYLRPNADTEKIAEDYVKGVEYPHKVAGDQDFITAAIQHHGFGEQVAYFPEDMIVSYRMLRRISRRDPKRAVAMLRQATILKFHGSPRPHELLSRSWQIRNAISSPGHLFKDWAFLSREVQNWWL